MPTASGNAVWALKATSVQFTCGCFPGTRVWNGDHRERERRAGSGDRATLKFLFPELTSCLSLSLLPLSLSLEFQFQGTKVRRLCLRILSSRNALDTAPDKVLSIETCGCDHIRPLGKMVLYDTVSPCLHIPYSSETNCTFEYAMKSWLRFLSFLL